MDLNAFYGVVATVDFALLGLWWVSVQARPDLRQRERHSGRMSYLVSLQFVIPGTAALLAQVAPQLTAIWRISFVVAGVTGVWAILALAPALMTAGSRTVAMVLSFGVVPLYVLVVVVSAVADLFSPGASLHALQVEAILFCLVTLVSVQVAWAAAMSPESRMPDRYGEARQ